MKCNIIVKIQKHQKPFWAKQEKRFDLLLTNYGIFMDCILIRYHIETTKNKFDVKDNMDPVNLFYQEDELTMYY